VGINFLLSFGGARMTSVVGFLQARSRDQSLIFEENECRFREEGEGKGVLRWFIEGGYRMFDMEEAQREIDRRFENS
jgi:hypothetical protein